jgi:hypothetical protein
MRVAAMFSRRHDFFPLAANAERGGAEFLMTVT